MGVIQVGTLEHLFSGTFKRKHWTHQSLLFSYQKTWQVLGGVDVIYKNFLCYEVLQN
jgi:hypothetical protein